MNQKCINLGEADCPESKCSQETRKRIPFNSPGVKQDIKVKEVHTHTHVHVCVYVCAVVHILKLYISQK